MTETRSSHDAVGQESWKAGVLLRSSNNTANPPHASAGLRISGSNRRCRMAINLFPTDQRVQNSTMTLPGCASLLPIILDNRCGVRPTRTRSPVSCIETTWEAPMRSTGMRGEPEYDVEKFGEAAEVTDWGYGPATKAQ